MNLIRTDSSNPDFMALVKQLDTYLAEIDGAEHAFYARLNKTAELNTVIVAYEDDKPIGCGAIRRMNMMAMEVKRMYTLPEYRGKGVATKILTELENWAFDLGYVKCVLETGKRQPEAIALYEKSGYKTIPNYGKYSGVENSVCYEKSL